MLEIRNKSFSLLLLTIFIISSNLYAQKINGFKYLTTSLLQEADSLICKRDTQNAILKFEEFINKEETRIRVFDNERLNCSLKGFIRPGSIKADICILISDLCIATNQLQKSFKYLELASSDYFPRYGGCANGMFMYQTKLSIHFADYYVKIGEKHKAIEVLLENFLANESYDKAASRKLKKILLTKYSQNYINKEITNGIENLTFEENVNAKEQKIQMTFFNKTIIKYSQGDLDTNKSYYKNNASIKTLMEI